MISVDVIKKVSDFPFPKVVLIPAGMPSAMTTYVDSGKITKDIIEIKKYYLKGEYFWVGVSKDGETIYIPAGQKNVIYSDISQIVPKSTDE